MARKTDDELAEGRMLRRIKAEARAVDKMDRQLDEAEKHIGQLTRDGKTIYYVYPVGGKYREGSRSDLISFLIRNRYV